MLIEQSDSLDFFFLRLRAQDHCDVIYKRDQVEGSSQERQERLQLGKERLQLGKERKGCNWERKGCNWERFLSQERSSLQLGKVSAILGKVKDPFLPFLSQNGQKERWER